MGKASLGLDQESVNLDSILFLLLSDHSYFLTMLKLMLDQNFQEDFSKDKYVLLAVEYLKQWSQVLFISQKVRLKILQFSTPEPPTPCITTCLYNKHSRTVPLVTFEFSSLHGECQLSRTLSLTFRSRVVDYC